MQDNPRLGIALMIATTVVFAVQDGISRYLAENYNVITVVTIRYMFFMCFVLAYGSRQKGGIRQMASSDQLPLQIGRGLLLLAQICVAILSFSTLGLVNFHAVFASYPLMVMALSVPILGEAVGWRRWLAVFVGFCGVLLILRPGTEMFSGMTILPAMKLPQLTGSCSLSRLLRWRWLFFKSNMTDIYKLKSNLVTLQFLPFLLIFG